MSDAARGAFVRHAAHDPAEAARELMKALPEDQARVFAAEVAMLAPSQVPGGLLPQNLATLSRLCVRLGLDPCGPTRNRGLVAAAIETHSRAEGWIPDVWHRQTGRTTHMLLEALAWIEGGSPHASGGNRIAVLLAPTHSVVSQLERRARGYLEALGWWPKLVRGVSTPVDLYRLAGQGSDRNRVRVFRDHTWYEFAAPREQLAALEIELGDVADPETWVEPCATGCGATVRIPAGSMRVPCDACRGLPPFRPATARGRPAGGP